MDKQQILEDALALVRIATRYSDTKPEQKVIRDKATELKNLVTEPLHVDGVPPTDEQLHAAWVGLAGTIDAELARDKSGLDPALPDSVS
jgi:hypothetical protein